MKITRVVAIGLIIFTSLAAYQFYEKREINKSVSNYIADVSSKTTAHFLNSPKDTKVRETLGWSKDDLRNIDDVLLKIRKLKPEHEVLQFTEEYLATCRTYIIAEESKLRNALAVEEYDEKTVAQNAILRATGDPAISMVINAPERQDMEELVKEYVNIKQQLIDSLNKMLALIKNHPQEINEVELINASLVTQRLIQLGAVK